MNRFKNIEYLKLGNKRQNQAYKELKELNIFEKLKKYNPILTGTVPIDIDVPESDLDIICECKNHREFSAELLSLFGKKTDFELKSYKENQIQSTTAKFKTDTFEIEIFGQHIPTEKQNAYRHMVIEDKILNSKGPEFRAEIRSLKSGGLKTEPAFAKLLGLNGNPYTELLKFEATIQAEEE
ncbi:DUF4269 domain-containing protein [Zobellia galactanivorans]|uniref:DUF4269 domain-containing protein n=1 Tax=Zobellia galactanivorans (strain DSM 12802 / CCUG 47099 / CIP 106680 / NCIMB 13871 / Dsij) TaxID=63186 RepID=G0LCU4_ZOBGA|nr:MULTISPECIES: DUF4269 domain-containing protein [Zobellia]MBU3027104.1 DUF4269 domain-containing protein [Zobellia galactanivorans]MDO6807966.1 DUF4269 domain-containing protein [Zobellia galactanivorans]OWW24866.1 diadenosine tetraphosphate hydrolase [Zobellia sp. OII3]CAZ94076.1 Conserved hypothetical protein [Zobellia galactanivorans]